MLPKPPSKALGIEASPPPALTIDVSAGEAELVESPVGATIDPRPVALGDTAVAGEEKLGLLTAVDIAAIAVVDSAASSDV